MICFYVEFVVVGVFDWWIKFVVYYEIKDCWEVVFYI